MKFLLINYEYPPIGAGAASATYHLARSLRDQGHRVIVCTSSFKRRIGRTVEDGIVVYRCAALRKKKDHSNLLEMGTFVLSSGLMLAWIVKREKIEATIVFFALPCGPLGLWAKFIGRTPFVISLRGGDVPGTEPRLAWLHGLLRPVRRLVYRHSTAICAPSAGLADLARKHDRIIVNIIPNGVDTRLFTPAAGSARPLRILFVGRLQPQKNLFFLIEQLHRVHQETRQPFTLHIVGDGPQQKPLRKYASTLGMDDLSVWEPWLDRAALVSRYRQADCFVNPSLYEGMPNTVLEAMACGLPVIASDIMGNQELVVPDETGFLFDLAKPAQFTQAVETLLRNRTLAQALGAAGRRRVEQHFCWSSVARQYTKLFVGQAR